MKNILVADDHEVTRRGVREILHDAFNGVNVVEVGSGTAALAVLPELGWDLILLDIAMPGPSIVDVIAGIRAHDAAVPILVLSGMTEPEYAVSTIRAGANGLVHKHRASDDLRDAMTMVTEGGTYLHPDTAIAIASQLRTEPLADAHFKLSSRELEIFLLIAVGKTVKVVAAKLELSDKTVATYITRIRDKTGLTNHVEIARYALRHGLVD